MALINQNDLFDRLQHYIDQKITGLPDEFRELFEEYGLELIAPYMEEIKIVADNITSVNLVGDNITAVIQVAFIRNAVARVAFIDDEVVLVANNDQNVNIVAADIDSVVIVSDNIQAVIDAPAFAWEAEAKKKTADSYATEPEDVFVKVWTSNGDGTFTPTDTTEYSSLHWAAKSEEAGEEIKNVGVVSPVTTVPNLPGNLPGVPTVTYSEATGDFTFGIPQGIQGDPALAVLPQGAATVAELNALVADPVVGNSWWMEDAGTITYGNEDTLVAIDDIVVWVGEGYFYNAGALTAGADWQLITRVTVDGAPSANDDDLARRSTSVNKAGDTMTGDLLISDAGGTQRVTFLRADGTVAGSVYHSDTTNQVVLARYQADGLTIASQLILGSDGVSIDGNASGDAVIEGTHDVVTKKYADTMLPKAGGTMSGNLGTEADIFMDGVAGSTRQFMFRDAADTIRANISYSNDSGSFYIRKRAVDGTTTECNLELKANGNVRLNGAGGAIPTPLDVGDLTPKNYVDTKLPLAGGNMTGTIKAPLIVMTGASTEGGQIEFEHPIGSTFGNNYIDVIQTGLRFLVRDVNNVAITASLDQTGNFMMTAAAPINIAHLTRKDYVDAGDQNVINRYIAADEDINRQLDPIRGVAPIPVLTNISGIIGTYYVFELSNWDILNVYSLANYSHPITYTANLPVVPAFGFYSVRVNLFYGAAATVPVTFQTRVAVPGLVEPRPVVLTLNIAYPGMAEMHFINVDFAANAVYNVGFTYP